MPNQALTRKNFTEIVNSASVKKRFADVLDKGAPAFISALIAVYNGTPALQECSPKTILAAAGLAATLKLSIAPSLGHAYILPYKGQATFVLGWKGLVQLAHRTGMYKKLHAQKVCEGEIRGIDPLTGEPVKGEKISDKVIGYVAYFELVNGFDKALYMTTDELKEHAQKYSKGYGKDSSPWTKHFDSMACKTVLKRLLNYWGPLSNDMYQAVAADQSVVDKETFTYVDNGGNSLDRATIEVPFETYEEPPEEKTELVNDETGEVVN